MNDDELQRLAQQMIQAIKSHQPPADNAYLLALCNDGHEFDLALEGALWFAIDNNIPLPDEMRRAAEIPLLVNNPILDHIDKHFSERNK